MGKKMLMLVTAVLMVLTTACSSHSNSENNLKNKQLVIGLPSDATTLLADTDVNSATDVQIRNIYDPLIKRDAKTGKFKPWLATNWRSINPNTWEFSLRKNVKFQNGVPFNAEAVKGSIDYILDKANKSAYLSRWASIKEVKVVDNYTVQVITSTPYPTFLHRIADDFLVMEPGYLKKVGLKKAANNPVGTGPYKLHTWKRNQYLRLVANNKYWAGKPKIKKVEFRYVPEFSSRLASFLNGEIDLFDNVPVDSVDQIKASSTGKVEQVKSARVDYLALNTFSNGPMKNQKVRQAINYAVDVPTLLKTQLNGYGVQITGPLAKNNQDYVPTNAYPYDPKKAVSLLNEAGYNPKKLTLTLDTPNGRYPMDKQVAQAIAAQLQKIGIKVNVHVNEWETHLSKIMQHRAGDMFLLGWGPSYEGQTTIQNLFTKSAPFSGFYDPEVESAINKALPLFNEQSRKTAFGKIEQMLVDKAAWVPLWQQENIYAVNKNLNFTPRTDETLQIFDMSWK
ncbi:hypothetical protein EWI07_08725 [Sporolactobacillus sp. THM7-4]|nr:hypothetical protein EWI07_08725 [Sporolactobacillus sp. THM7-4]